MALSAPNFPVFYRSLPISSTNFSKKMNFFLTLYRPEFRYFRAFRCFFLLAKWLSLAVFSPSTLCEPLRLGLRCVETNSKTG